MKDAEFTEVLRFGILLVLNGVLQAVTNVGSTVTAVVSAVVVSKSGRALFEIVLLSIEASPGVSWERYRGST